MGKDEIFYPEYLKRLVISIAKNYASFIKGDQSAEHLNEKVHKLVHRNKEHEVNCGKYSPRIVELTGSCDVKFLTLFLRYVNDCSSSSSSSSDEKSQYLLAATFTPGVNKCDTPIILYASQEEYPSSKKDYYHDAKGIIVEYFDKYDKKKDHSKEDKDRKDIKDKDHENDKDIKDDHKEERRHEEDKKIDKYEKDRQDFCRYYYGCLKNDFVVRADPRGWKWVISDKNDENVKGHQKDNMYYINYNDLYNYHKKNSGCKFLKYDACNLVAHSCQYEIWAKITAEESSFGYRASVDVDKLPQLFKDFCQRNNFILNSETKEGFVKYEPIQKCFSECYTIFNFPEYNKKCKRCTEDKTTVWGDCDYAEGWKNELIIASLEEVSEKKSRSRSRSRSKSRHSKSRSRHSKSRSRSRSRSKSRHSKSRSRSRSRSHSRSKSQHKKEKIHSQKPLKISTENSVSDSARESTEKSSEQHSKEKKSDSHDTSEKSFEHSSEEKKSHDSKKHKKTSRGRSMKNGESYQSYISRFYGEDEIDKKLRGQLPNESYPDYLIRFYKTYGEQ
jgi:hypothetical protein